MNVSPIAINDAYTAVGNTLLEVGNATTRTGPQSSVAGSVIANDVEFFGDTFVISAVGAAAVTGATTTITTALGGMVVMVTDNLSADRGSLTYISQAGDTGVDSFTYTIRDKGLDGTAGTADDLGRLKRCRRLGEYQAAGCVVRRCGKAAATCGPMVLLDAEASTILTSAVRTEWTAH